MEKGNLPVEFPWYFILQKLEKDGIYIYNIFPSAHKRYQYWKILYDIHIELFTFLPALSAASPVCSEPAGCCSGHNFAKLQ